MANLSRLDDLETESSNSQTVWEDTTPRKRSRKTDRRGWGYYFLLVILLSVVMVGIAGMIMTVGM